MARDRANLRTDLWGDSDWRKLSVGAQHLYMLILSHPTLNYAGVADWRAGRLAALTCGRTRSDVELDAKELTRAAFIYPDELTEEVVVRSFLRHDGVIKHPRLHVSMANDYAGIASDAIRSYIAFELGKLHVESPTLALWSDPRVQTILKATARDMKADTQEDAIEIPAPLPKPLAKDSHRDPMPTATATATSSKEDVSCPATPDEFDQWYSAYPRKEAKESGRKAFTKARKKASLEELTAGLARYVEATRGKDREFIALPATWLNAGRWEDEAPAQTSSPWSKEFHQ